MKTLAQLGDLTGRCALVTGGAGHLGGAAAEALVELGARVAISDRDSDACHAAADALGRSRPGAVHALACDLADEAATRDLARRTEATLGGLDILVHSAAYVGTTTAAGWAVPFATQTVEAWDAAMRVNVTPVFVLAQAAGAALARSGRGSIVVFSSIYGLVGPDLSLYDGTPMANPAGYGASKGALQQLVRYLATVLAPAVRVNAISPGGVRRGQPPVFTGRYEARTPLGRMATEEDLKGAVAYLASDLSAYVTGQNLVVDGGWTTW